MKKFTVLVFLMAFLIGTASCGSRTDSNPSQSIPDLSGQWKQVNSDSQNRYQGAIIDGNTIEIYWVVNNGDTYSLYWSGSFVAPTTADELYSWVSDNNKEKTERAMLASHDDTKAFSYANDQISYSSSIMGTTTTVRLERDNWASGLEIEDTTKKEASTSQKRDKSGFCIETNQRITFGGVDFSIPDYYDTVDKKSTEIYKHYYPERSDYNCSLILRVEDTKISQSDFDFGKENAAKEMISKYSSGSAIEIKSEPKQIADLSGWSFSFKMGPDTENLTVVNGAFALDPDNQKLLLVVQMYDSTDRSDIDYTGDFDKIIESAERTFVPRTNDEPLPFEGQEANQEEPSKPESTAEALVDGMRAEFKVAMDSYEAYIDRYCDFMENYDVSNISMLTEFAKLMGQYADMTEKFEQWEDSDLNDTELAYYLQVQSNINQKLLAVTP